MTDAVLRPPAGRQGPGPMPQALVDELDLVVARRAAGALPGDRLAAGLGTGTELAQLRPYEVGDDVRQIDPSATARTGEPHVRLQVPERTLTTWIVLDVSASMAFGTALRLKSDVAEGAALVLARLGIRRAGRVGLVRFGAGEVALIPPRASRRGVVAVRREARVRRLVYRGQDLDAEQPQQARRDRQPAAGHSCATSGTLHAMPSPIESAPAPSVSHRCPRCSAPSDAPTSADAAAMPAIEPAPNTLMYAIRSAVDGSSANTSAVRAPDPARPWTRPTASGRHASVHRPR